MPKMDVTKFIEQSGIRRARFGGYEPDDVRAAIQALCTEYEQRLGRAERETRALRAKYAALEQHCQTLANQNKRLSGQNATLAGSSEAYSRQRSALDTEMSSLRERNHSLNDQCAVLRLKNDGLQKENAELKEKTEQAKAELRIKGRELDAARSNLDAARQKTLDEAATQAAKTMAAARRQADQVQQDALLQAEAIDRTAREQARAQAQRIVDAAAAEANEIQNAHQLRLNNLKEEVRVLEAQRERLIDYLERLAAELKETARTAADEDPAAEAAADDNAGRELQSALPDLKEVPTPPAELDLDPAAIARAVDELRAQAAGAAEGQDADGTPDAPPADHPAAEAARELLDDDPNRQTGPALTEVPGAIFSSPIVHQDAPAVPDEPAPSAGPRAPVMPEVLDDDEDLPDEPPADAPPAHPDTPARRKALRALRALRRMTAEKGGR